MTTCGRALRGRRKCFSKVSFSRPHCTGFAERRLHVSYERLAKHYKFRMSTAISSAVTVTE